MCIRDRGDPLSTLCRFSSLVGWRLGDGPASTPCRRGLVGVLAEQYATKLLEPDGRIIESDQDRLSRWDGEGEDAGAAAIRGLEPIGEIGVVGQPGELEDKVVWIGTPARCMSAPHHSGRL